MIESVKAASDILAPLDGEIVEVNSLLRQPSTRQRRPAIGDAWFFKMKPSDLSQMDDYMDEAGYKNVDSATRYLKEQGAPADDRSPPPIICRMILPTAAISAHPLQRWPKCWTCWGAKDLELIDRDTFPRRSVSTSRLILASQVRARIAAPHADHSGQEQSADFAHRAGLSRHGDAARDPAQHSENPAWYTAYTPISQRFHQGRLEALLNFQTMVTDLTGLDVANASLLDEATACAEAMTMAQRVSKSKAKAFFVDEDCHPQNIAVMKTRAAPLGIEIIVGNPTKMDASDVFGAIFQYPGTYGHLRDFTRSNRALHDTRRSAIVAADPLR